MLDYQTELTLWTTAISCCLIATIWLAAHHDAAWNPHNPLAQSATDHEGRTFSGVYAWFLLLSLIPVFDNSLSVNTATAILSCLSLLRVSGRYFTALPNILRVSALRLVFLGFMSAFCTLLSSHAELSSLTPLLCALLGCLLQFRVRALLLWQLAEDNQSLREKLAEQKHRLRNRQKIA